MIMRRFLLAILVSFLCAPLACSTNRSELEFNGHKRSVYLYVPKSVTAGSPAPLLLLFHGSGRSGSIMIDNWKSLADKEGVVLAAPDALDPQQWNLKVDSVEFL